MKYDLKDVVYTRNPFLNLLNNSRKNCFIDCSTNIVMVYSYPKNEWYNVFEWKE